MYFQGICRVAVFVWMAVAVTPVLRAAESAAFTIDTQGSAASNASSVFQIDTTDADALGGGALSAAFEIDTTGSDVPRDGALSSTFVIDTTAPEPSGGGALSSMFVIDTQAVDALGLAAFSAYFTIDTREDSEKLRFKYALWAAANMPVGQRDMDDVTDLFGITNLLAFGLGWEAGDPSTWYRARIHEVDQTLPVTGVWLRAQRRNDLPELLWTWTASMDLQGFPTASALQEESSTGLGGLLEQWDVRVPLPASMDKHFYQLKIYYNNNTP